jgi:hypothetical protein
MRLIVLASISLIAAGCGSSTLATAGGAAATSGTHSPAPGAATSSSATTAPPTPTGSTPAGTPASGTVTSPGHASPAGRGCPGSAIPALEADSFTGMQFVSSAEGWAVGPDTIMATSDGGAHWRTQLSGTLNLTAVDFVNGQDGWAVGTSSLLATTDGGAEWTPLPEPCPLLRSVHFITPLTGYAVAGGSDAGVDPEAPNLGGVVLTTSDGGHTWHAAATPPDAQTVCFSDGQHGWLGADGLLYRTTDGGRDWTVTTAPAGQVQSGYVGTMDVQCAGDGSAWALLIGPGAGMSQEPHVGYHADQAGATPIFAEQYFHTPGTPPAAQAPGSYAGPFSALSPSAAVFIDWCTACGLGTAPWDVATNSGATLTREGNVGMITDPEAASFLSSAAGWVAGSDNEWNAAGSSRAQQRIVATTDGGRTWHVEYAGPWSPWTG